MSITKGRFEFDGPYADTEERSSVHAILCRQDEGYGVVDVGESATVRSRIENHDRAACWCGVSNALAVALCYTPGLSSRAARRSSRNSGTGSTRRAATADDGQPMQ